MQAWRRSRRFRRSSIPAWSRARVPLDQIPVIDFGPFLNGSAAERKAVARQIGEACRNIGFFYLINHGVPPALTRTDLRGGPALLRLAAREEAGDRHREIALPSRLFRPGRRKSRSEEAALCRRSQGGHQDRPRPAARSSPGQGGHASARARSMAERTCRAGARRCRPATTPWSSSGARSCMPSRLPSSCRRIISTAG